jgi:magnesium-transporting ATPase (P-type)
LERSGQALEQIELIKKSNDFTTEAIHNDNRAIVWLVASGITLLIFASFLLYFVFCDNHSTEIIVNASKDKVVYPYATFLLTAFYVTKALLLSTLLYILGWFLKNYRSEKHNYIINKHKAMTLTVATAILTKEDYKSTDRGSIFIQAMEIIFTHQVSGFSTDDKTSPSVVNTLLQKGIPKSGDNAH